MKCWVIFRHGSLAKTVFVLCEGQNTKLKGSD
jgi:hypothetical protein